MTGRRTLTAQPHGFTLVEILIVVTILGILAAIVIPQFASAADESRQSSMEQTVHRIRQQIEIYAAQHGGDYPTSATTFVDQMTNPTDLHGTVGNVAGVHRFGPYIRDMPTNPYTGENTVGSGGIGTSDWFYEDGVFRANNAAAQAAY